MSVRPRFTNPSNGAFYDWQVGHAEEEETGKTRNITRTSPTGNVGLVKQQGDDGPLLLRYTGAILHRNQYRQMWFWYELSRTQTIYFRDFDGQEYEVQITSFTRQRHRKLTTSKKDPSVPNHYWTYTIEMEVYAFRVGDEHDMGVTP